MSSDDLLTREQIAKRRDDAIRRALNTPKPKPTAAPNKKAAKAKPRRRKGINRA
jgi:hypothetical protein